MPFDAAGLRTIGHLAPAIGVADTPFAQEHTYVTPDAAAVVEAANYFNTVTRRFRKGDLLRCIMAIAGTPVLKNYVVTSATGAAVVTVALQTVTAG